MFKQLDEYQARAHLTAAVKQGGRVGKAWSAMEFASEWMELGALIMSNATKSQFRPKGKPEKEFVDKLKGELGDALWTISEVALSYGLHLSEVANDNLAKVQGKHGGLNREGAEHGRSKDVPDVAGNGGVAGKSQKPANPFPWVKGNKKQIKACPECGSATKFAEGCVSCLQCSWSACS